MTNIDGKRTNLASQRLLEQIESLIGDPVTVEGQLAGGWNNGALRVRVRNEAFVLKIHGQRTYEELQAIRNSCVAARNRGWPTPAWRSLEVTDDGERWSLQEFVAGDCLQELTEGSAFAVVKANQLQAGLAPAMHGKERLINRSAVVTDMLERDKFGHLAILRRFSDSGRRLVELVRERAFPLPTLPTDDLVHGDYNPENILMTAGVAGAVSAFVDTDELGFGTRYFDLADLFNKSYRGSELSPGQQVLANAVIDGIGEAGFIACLATNSIGTMAWMAERMPHRLPNRIDALLGLYGGESLTRRPRKTWV